jgi:type IV pilus assembly protein PilP
VFATLLLVAMLFAPRQNISFGQEIRAYAQNSTAKEGSRAEMLRAVAAEQETPQGKLEEKGPSSAVARRDPFRPITLNFPPTVRRRENLSPLERFEIGQLKLVGIIWDVKHPTALVEDTSGLGYVVRPGTPIGANDGKVRAIQQDSLLIEEEYLDLYGVKKRRDVSMKLAAEKAE